MIRMELAVLAIVASLGYSIATFNVNMLSTITYYLTGI